MSAKDAPSVQPAAVTAAKPVESAAPSRVESTTVKPENDKSIDLGANGYRPSPERRKELSAMHENKLAELRAADKAGSTATKQDTPKAAEVTTTKVEQYKSSEVNRRHVDKATHNAHNVSLTGNHTSNRAHQQLPSDEGHAKQRQTALKGIDMMAAHAEREYPACKKEIQNFRNVMIDLMKKENPTAADVLKLKDATDKLQDAIKKEREPSLGERIANGIKEFGKMVEQSFKEAASSSAPKQEAKVASETSHTYRPGF